MSTPEIKTTRASTSLDLRSTSNEKKRKQSNENDDTNISKKSNSKKQKRTQLKHPKMEPYKLQHILLPKSNEPGSPHSIFQSSYKVSVFSLPSSDLSNESQKNLSSLNVSDKSIKKKLIGEQIVHCHQNSLCIITAGSSLGNFISSQLPQTQNTDLKKDENQTNNVNMNKINTNTNPIIQIKYLQKIHSGSQGKNKKQKAMKSKFKSMFVEPYDPLMEIHFKDGRIQTFYCCVYGSLVELNSNLQQGSAKCLIEDPLMNGYLAIILPMGRFPPISS